MLDKRKGYTISENYIMDDVNLSMGAYRCYQMLLSMCQDKDYCYPSLKYLAEKLGRSVKQVSRYISELVNAKLINKRRRGSISNIYTVFAKVKQFFSNINHTVKEKTKDLKPTTTQKNVTNGQNNPIVKEIKSVAKNKPKKVDNFCNYEQRDPNYYLSLEYKLLGWE
ncbi:Helix-turn-helix domain-containing protein [Hathewaya proteolytica DSM 3090]|uniref:Helix-turn-helix domain-containing protein n=1 Tax=Hathewaya proteolytica DSM 3090 TaxID=1121331 RepID=A0A1M6L3D8_9CLOT|nr:helix-turn-helix domain-containing protein [Hathewaya proteolytica]SHJ65697.1 Helix-turn-helix domain-containing protein [Hathewaya proteolytica DSM 3090]